MTLLQRPRKQCSLDMTSVNLPKAVEILQMRRVSGRVAVLIQRQLNAQDVRIRASVH
uniref:Uncharacterized protein n=1 Tax=Brassica oleracea var. oleracea TaxID=109376 RepID=A0A0D3BUG7_BRAOL